VSRKNVNKHSFVKLTLLPPNFKVSSQYLQKTNRKNINKCSFIKLIQKKQLTCQISKFSAGIVSRKNVNKHSFVKLTLLLPNFKVSSQYLQKTNRKNINKCSFIKLIQKNNLPV